MLWSTRTIALRQRETHPVCLSCFAESATKASLALDSVPYVFHLALIHVQGDRNLVDHLFLRHFRGYFGSGKNCFLNGFFVLFNGICGIPAK